MKFRGGFYLNQKPYGDSKPSTEPLIVFQRTWEIENLVKYPCTADISEHRRLYSIVVDDYIHIYYYIYLRQIDQLGRFNLEKEVNRRIRLVWAAFETFFHREFPMDMSPKRGVLREVMPDSNWLKSNDGLLGCSNGTDLGSTVRIVPTPRRRNALPLPGLWQSGPRRPVVLAAAALVSVDRNPRSKRPQLQRYVEAERDRSSPNPSRRPLLKHHRFAEA